MSKLSDKIRQSKILLKQKQWQVEPALLLCPNIPQPLHGLAPRVVLGNVWWNAERQAAYRSTAYHCLACGVWKMVAPYRQWLEGHEVYAINYHRGRMVYQRTVPLCHLCHNFIHDGRLQYLLEQGKITHAKYCAVLQHGQQVLADAGLQRPTREQRMLTILSRGVVPWRKWRLVVHGKQYAPLWNSLEEQQRASHANQ